MGLVNVVSGNFTVKPRQSKHFLKSKLQVVKQVYASVKEDKCEPETT